MFKTLIDKNTGEFVVFLDINGNITPFTSNEPRMSFPDTATFESIKESYKTIDFSDYDLIEYEIVEPSEIGADIRNKLSPIKNLITILKQIKNSDKSLDEKEKMINIAMKQIDSCDESIDYLKDLF